MKNEKNISYIGLIIPKMWQFLNYQEKRLIFGQSYVKY